MIANLNDTNLAKMNDISNQDSQQSNGINQNKNFVEASYTILGCPVILRVKSNDTFHGIFVTYSPEFDVLLECCHKIDPKNEVVIFGRSLPKKTEVHARFFERENIVEMTAYEVDKDFAIKTAENNFIDSAIAQKTASVSNKINNSNNSEDNNNECKELEPFPFEDDDHNNTGSGLNSADDDLNQQMNGIDLDNGLEANSSSGGGWNAEEMLLTNQTKYGYKSTYNSDLTEYTLAVEKEDTEEYRRREREAEKIAHEIESSSAYRKNIDKELTDNEDEEEAFSAVFRTKTFSNSSGEINNNYLSNGFHYKESKYYRRRSFNKSQQSSYRNSNNSKSNGNINSCNSSYLFGSKNCKSRIKRYSASNYLQTI